MIGEYPSIEQILIFCGYTWRNLLCINEIIDRTVLTIAVSLGKIDSATFEYKKSMHHGQVGQYVSIQDCFRPGHQCFSHGIDADILVDGDFQLSGQRGNDCMLGGATAHVFLK